MIKKNYELSNLKQNYNYFLFYGKNEGLKNNAINNLIVSESDSVVSVQEEREPMFNYGKSGLNLINPGRFKDLSFDKERLYRFNGSIIATWWEVLKADTLFGEKIAHIEMSNLDSLQIKTSAMLEYFNNLKS